MHIASGFIPGKARIIENPTKNLEGEEGEQRARILTEDDASGALEMALTQQPRLRDASDDLVDDQAALWAEL
jgi:hypothetical protein